MSDETTIPYIIGILFRRTSGKSAIPYVVNYYFIEHPSSLEKKEITKQYSQNQFLFNKNGNEQFIKVVFLEKLPSVIGNGSLLFSVSLPRTTMHEICSLSLHIPEIIEFEKAYKGALVWREKQEWKNMEMSLKKMYIYGVASKRKQSSPILDLKFFYFEKFSEEIVKKLGKEHFGILFFTPLYETFENGNELFFCDLPSLPKGKRWLFDIPFKFANGRRPKFW
ncbi:MAG: hypothetical protein LBV54_07410 [Puniceicoccales bacterium]|jgi:hypothetical protein|nr:hypothetical protein [Puniceicoccales bacterium]